MLALTAFCLSLILVEAGCLTSLENLSIDWRLRLTRRDCRLPPDIVLILIDEASLDALNPIAGRWPWDRRVHAAVIDFLNMAGARAIVFDVLFTEQQDRGREFSSKSADALLAAATSQAGVIHAAQLAGQRGKAGAAGSRLPRDFADRFGLRLEAQGLKLPEKAEAYLPYARLAEAAGAVGVVSVEPDHDGVIRRMPLLFSFGGNILPGLALAAVLMGKEPVRAEYRSGHLEIRAGGRSFRVPADRRGRIRVNPYGRYEAFSYSGVYLSLQKMMDGQFTDLPVPPGVFRDKIIFVGASAAGVEDLKTTSLGPGTPGVLLHASVMANLLENDFLMDAPRALEPVLAALMAAMTVGCVVYGRSLWCQVAVPLSGGIVLWWAALMLASKGLLIWLAGPTCALLLSHGGCLATERFIDRLEKARIRNYLGQYVSPVVLDRIIACHGGDYLGAEVGTQEKLTIMFSDLRGFTTISQSMPVDQVVGMLNRYLSLMTEKIFQHQGTLDKFIGDAVVAFWGAPLPDRDHSFKAVCCALEMQKALDHFNRCRRRPAEPFLKMGIGVNTDMVILGNIGSARKLDYTVVGDGVNLASRLEGLTKRYRVPVVISHATYRRVRDRIVCRPLDVVRVKGRKGKTRIYQPLGLEGELERRLLQVAALSRQGLELFLECRFRQAQQVYDRILRLLPGDRVAGIFAGRCRSRLSGRQV